MDKKPSLQDLIEFKDIILPLVKPSAIVIGNGLASIFEITLNPLIYMGKKSTFNYDLKYSEFVEDASRMLNNVDDRNLVEPELHVIAPIIDQAKFLVSEESFRLRFAQLIAASCNKEVNSSIRPIHSKIISSMSAIDAHIFNYICNNLPMVGLSAVKPLIIPKDKRFFSMEHAFKEILIINPKSELHISIQEKKGLVDIDKYSESTISESMDTILSLGLISIEGLIDLRLTNFTECGQAIEDDYEFFLDSAVYSEYKLYSNDNDYVVSCRPYKIKLTTLGETFANLTLNMNFIDVDHF